MQSHLPSEVAGWRNAIQGMNPDKSPCHRLSIERWMTMREACFDFIDRFGSNAHRLGWTTADLFAVHPVYGTLRVDSCGALMVSGNTAVAVGADRIRFDAPSGYRNVPGRPEGVPIWEFTPGGRKARLDA